MTVQYFELKLLEQQKNRKKQKYGIKFNVDSSL